MTLSVNEKSRLTDGVLVSTVNVQCHAAVEDSHVILNVFK